MQLNGEFSQIPLIDIAPLVGAGGDRRAVADAIGRACRECGFFYVVGHGVDPALQARLEAQAQRFFARPLEEKLAIRMERGGAAWRGYFPVGDELTSGRPDAKEGVYFGAELAAAHPLVRAGTPLHGPNLFPEQAGFRDAVLDWMDAMTRLGHALMGGIALCLDLPEDWFAARYTGDPLVLFRIFNYPEIPPGDARSALERRRAHRLRRADDPAAGRRRRPPGQVARRSGSTRRRCRAPSSATSATCSTA